METKLKEWASILEAKIDNGDVVWTIEKEENVQTDTVYGIPPIDSSLEGGFENLPETINFCCSFYQFQTRIWCIDQEKTVFILCEDEMTWKEVSNQIKEVY